MGLYMSEVHINRTENYHMGDEYAYETIFESTGEMFRSIVKDLGRCTGKCYIDEKDGKRRQVGWVFLKRDKYEDTGESFLHETWVSVLDGPDKIIRKRQYHVFDQ